MATALVLRLTKLSNNRTFRCTLPVVIGTAALVACINKSTSLSAQSNDDEEDDSDRKTGSTNVTEQRQTQHPDVYENDNPGVSLYDDLKVSSPCLCERGTKDATDFIDPPRKPRQSIRRRQTIVRMDKESTKDILEARYNIHWDDEPLGEGAFGKVYLATKKNTTNKKINSGEKVAIKKIDKKCTDRESFQREMRALLDIREFGGHPNICGLQEHFNLGKYYYLVLDLIGGGELFDNLMCNGGYSEADAARLVREVASALAFLHGIGVVHADLKPENLMLSTPNRGDAVIKLVDFGSAEVLRQDDKLNSNTKDDIERSTETGFTPAYCPPEALVYIASAMKPAPKPSHDMWALGVILYIMLTGVHPYDLSGNSSDEHVEARIMSPDRYKVPLSHDSPYTNHLSDSAIDLISELMNRDPTARLTAHEMLSHPWVRGETATTEVITGSDERLNKLKFKMQRKFFEDVVNWSDDDDETRHKGDLIERSFQSFDVEKKGFLTDNDLGENVGEVNTPSPSKKSIDNTEDGGPTLTMSDFSNVLSANMNSQYFPKGHLVYQEGDIGNHMYFINSGKVEVTTKDGSIASRSQGDFFGEGALLDGERKRSATIKCKSPVHAMQINREYLEKVFKSSESGIFLTLREKDKIRKRNRAKVILRMQNNLQEARYKENESVFETGDDGDSIFIVDKGKVSVTVMDKNVFSVTPGNVFGENSVLTGRSRNSSALCKSEQGCITQKLSGSNFRKVVEASPYVRESLTDLCRRRDFKKSVVLRLNKDFPYENPREAFDAVDSNKKGFLDVESVAEILRDMDSSYTNDEIEKVIGALNLSNSGKIEFDEFKKVFVADIRMWNHVTQTMRSKK